MAAMFVIEVDARERKAALASALARRGDVELRVSVLRAGDYAIGRGVGVERKSADDLARSIVDGRLFRQARALVHLYERPLLLVEGMPADGPVLGVSAEAIRGALVSLAAIFRIPTLHVGGPDEAAEVVVTAARQFERSFHDGYVRPGRRPRGLRSRRLFVLQGLPRVGPRRAAALLDHFGSVAAVMGAAPARFLEIPGIGPGVARGIDSLLRGDGTASAETM